MNQSLRSRIRLLVVGVATLFIMILFSACGVSVAGTGQGTGSGTSSNTITGSVVNVNQANHSVTVSANGQLYTINGLTDQEIQQIQQAQGKTWSFQVTSNNGTYTVSTGTNSVEQSNGTPEANVTPQGNGNQGTGAVEPGSISFDGAVQNVSPSSISVKMPNGNILSMSITALTDRGDFGTGLPSNGQLVKVDAVANTDGSFLAKSLDMVKPDDQANPTKLNTVDFQGVTTSAVGANGVINFNVGNKSYSFTIGPTTQVKDFAGAQTIGSGQAVKVTVLFNGSTGSVLEVKNSNS